MGIVANLIEISKRIWPTFPIKIKRYTLQNILHTKIGAQGLEELRLLKGTSKQHDPKGVVKDYYFKARHKVYTHESSLDDSLFHGSLTYKEVEQRI